MFGAYSVVSATGDGRFGPVFIARRSGEAAVLVRTFTIPMSDLQRTRLVGALKTLCERPLEHPSIARPLASGVQDGRPYLVHTCLPGTSLADLAKTGHPDLSDVIVRLTYLAGALDFAEGAGVLHGALSARDVIFSDDNAGVSGFGLVQALESAGIPGFHARREDDVAALMGIARDLLGDGAAPPVAAVLAGPVPRTALEFAAALQVARAAVDPGIPAPLDAELPEPEMWASELPRDLFDIPLREEHAAREPDDFIEPITAPPISIERPMFGASMDLLDDAGTSVRVPRQRPGWSRGWLITGVVALALGVFAGFAGGFFVGHDAPEGSTAVAAPPAPEPTNGQTFTDAAVDEPKPQEPTATSPGTPTASAPVKADAEQEKPGVARPLSGPRAEPDPSSRSRPTSVRTRTVPPPEPPSGPAAMRVESLPAGAQVFVDGRSVGYTPMVVGDLTPGTHSVRMQLPGYHPWVSAVTLGPGARQRVAASLEQ